MNRFTFKKLGRVLVLLAVGLFGCVDDNGTNSGGGNNNGGGSGVSWNNTCGKDGTDGSCKTVVIGGKTWLAENLNYQTDYSWCYKDSNSYCSKYGRLYDWNAAKMACQSIGWKLPDTADWNRLVTMVGGTEVAGKKLKARSGWGSSSSYNGTDDFVFSALPGVFRFFTGTSFGGAGQYGHWWTDTEIDDLFNGHNAFGQQMGSYNNNVVLNGNSKDYGWSVRCIKND